MHTVRFVFSLLSTFFALQVMAQGGPVDAAAYFSGEPFGWAVCSDVNGTAYVLDGGNRSVDFNAGITLGTTPRVTHN